MLDAIPSINPNFNQEDNAKLASLMKYEPQQDHVKTIRTRTSRLDPYLPEILKRRSQNWSYQRIADELKLKHGFIKLNKSTVMRRLNKFFEAE